MHLSTESNALSHAPSHQVYVTVFAPRAVEPKSFTWEKTMKVGDAAKQAAVAFGYQTGNPGLQTIAEPPVVLDNNKPLVAEHVKDGDQLELVDTGGGV
jgi:hypothetical protein